ncbi:uncharacterized protein LOC135207861 [Macrobrachium nipponense]|uniref:uncharacterized protein LOC135207861 n=1 Tax=Macrobrachium nipponense TaxID=159736 RepID=UPI0030C89B92
MHFSWIIFLGLLATPSPAVDADTMELLSTGYTYMIHGGRLLHDVAGGMSLITKMFRAFDYFMDNTAQEQINEALEDAEEDSEETTQSSSSVPQDTQTSSQETRTPPTVVPDSSARSPPPEPSRSPEGGGPPNGCGVLGLQIKDPSLPVAELSQCCAEHDACYSSVCKTKKRQCDRKLKGCFVNVCDDLTLEWQIQKNCLGAAKLLYAGTMALSSQQYKNAQEKLSCRKESKRRGRR